MENRATKSGFAREVQQRINEKYSAEEAAKTLRWVRALEPSAEVPQHLVEAMQTIPAEISSASQEEFHAYLKDGLVLGCLIGCLKPADAKSRLSVKTWTVSDKKIFETNRQRERIGAFLLFCNEMGVGSASVFQTDQLYEQTNLPQVVICLSQLGVEAQAQEGYSGPAGFWMQKHTTNKRNFTEQQLKGGESVIGLQMGYSGGANQSGTTFGAHRQVTDSF